MGMLCIYLAACNCAKHAAPVGFAVFMYFHLHSFICISPCQHLHAVHCWLAQMSDMSSDCVCCEQTDTD